MHSAPTRLLPRPPTPVEAFKECIETFVERVVDTDEDPYPSLVACLADHDFIDGLTSDSVEAAATRACVGSPPVQAARDALLAWQQHPRGNDPDEFYAGEDARAKVEGEAFARCLTAALGGWVPSPTGGVPRLRRW